MIGMIEAVLSGLAISLLSALGSLLIGYFIFRNDQKNKNQAIITRFENVENNLNNHIVADREIIRELKDGQKSLEKGHLKLSTDIAETSIIVKHVEKVVNHIESLVLKEVGFKDE